MTIETTVNGGLAVIASGNVQRAEPDVGIMSQFVEDLQVTFLNGYPMCPLSCPTRTISG